VLQVVFAVSAAVFNCLKFWKYSFTYLTLGFWRHNRRRLIWRHFDAILSILSICK